jgi:hypothetical protein
MSIVITRATGQLGRLVVEQLTAKHSRVLSRDLSRCDSWVSNN